MTEDMFGMAGFTAFLAGILWWLAGYRSGRLAYARTPRQLRARAMRLLALIGAAALLADIKAALIVADWPTGWGGFEGKLALDLTLLLVPEAAVLACAAPRLLRVRAMAKAAETGAAAGERPAAELRGAAADPLLVLPVQAAAIAAGGVFYLTFFTAIPVAPTVMLAVPAAVVGAAALLGLRQRLRRRAMLAAAWRRPSGGRRALRAAAGVIAVAAALTLWLVAAAQSSRLPDRVGMMSGTMDYGGGAAPAGGAHDHAGHAGAQPVSVVDLTGPREGAPDRQFTLTATKATVKLASGAAVEAWTFDGGLPGPELRVKQGELVEVKLVNRDIEEGVTIHWHGVDLPNAEDGVAGVTQDAVKPGQSYKYRFVAEDAGTYWYHSHQETLEAEGKGLFGALIVEPREPLPAGTRDIAVTAHTWPVAGGGLPRIALGASDTDSRQTIAPGTPVRLRLINTDINEKTFRLVGTPFRVAAIDGTDLNEPGELTNRDLQLAAGGRYDVTFVMPATPVTLAAQSDDNLDGGSRTASLIMSADGTSGAPVGIADFRDKQPLFDPLAYGKPAETPFGADSAFDREFTLVLGQKLGFYDGSFAYALTINGKLFPNTPMLMVREGDLAKTTFVNHSSNHHPMHLHGHHMLVLSRNGVAASGSPWWTDTLDVAPGDTYTVAFLADNPGVWMDHCHNLQHASVGMMMHLGYEGVMTPFSVGRATANHPE